MSYFHKDEAAYSKLELDPNHAFPLSYYDQQQQDPHQLIHIPSLPETTYSSRFEEQFYPQLPEQQRLFHPGINVTPPSPPIITKTRRSYCQLFSHIAFLLGIALIVISIGFKFLSRSHINQAIDQACPVACVTTCYHHLPFYQPSIQCNEQVKAACDASCGPVGMKTANAFAILFFTCVLLGGILVVAQVVYACWAYCCFDYSDYKKTARTKGGPFV